MAVAAITVLAGTEAGKNIGHGVSFFESVLRDHSKYFQVGRYNSRAQVSRLICYQVGCVTCGCRRKAGGDRVAVAAWRPLWRERLLSEGQVTSRTRRGGLAGTWTGGPL